MAQLTLPHPDLDFTPMDILTAAEQNQLMANITALASFSNGLADGSNISDNTILASKLNLLSLPSQQQSSSGYVEIGDILIQWGTMAAGVGSTNERTINFSQSFDSGNYKLIATPSKSDNNSFWWVNVINQSAGNTKIRTGWKNRDGTGGNASANCDVEWMAIGKKA